MTELEELERLLETEQMKVEPDLDLIRELEQEIDEAQNDCF